MGVCRVKDLLAYILWIFQVDYRRDIVYLESGHSKCISQPSFRWSSAVSALLRPRYRLVNFMQDDLARVLQSKGICHGLICSYEGISASNWQ